MTYLVTMYKSERGYCPCVEKQIKFNFDPELAKQRLLEPVKKPNMFMQFLASIILRYKL